MTVEALPRPDPTGRGLKRRLHGAAAGTFLSVSVPNFRLFLGGQLISQIGNWLTMIAQTLLVLHLGGNGLDVGLLTACQFLPVLVLGPWAGLVADRSDKRRLLLVVQILAMVQSFVLAALAFSGDPPIWSIFLVASAGGVAVAFDNPARRAFVVEMVPETHVNNAVSLNSALMTGSRVVGPALAGLLIGVAGFGWCFTIDAVSYVAVLVGLWMMNPRELTSPPATPRAGGQVRAGVRYVSSVPDLWVPLVMMAIVGTFTFNFQVVLPLFARDALGGGETLFTLLFSVISVGSFLGALWVARRTDIQVRDVTLTAAGFGAAMLALSAAPTTSLAFPAGFVMGIASIAFMTASTAIVQVRADPTMRGRVLALQAMVFLGSTPVGGPILGLVCDQLGARAGVALGGGAALGAAAWGARTDRRVRSRKAAPTGPRRPDGRAAPTGPGRPDGRAAPTGGRLASAT